MWRATWGPEGFDQASVAWWYVDDSPHLAALSDPTRMCMYSEGLSSEQARLLKTVKDHICDSENLVWFTPSVKPRACQPHASVICGYRLGQESVGTQSALRWRHNGCDSVSNHQPHHCLLNRLLRRRSKKTSKLRVTGLCAGNSPGTGEFSAQMASNAKNVSIWWRHHG